MPRLIVLRALLFLLLLPTASLTAQTAGGSAASNDDWLAVVRKPRLYGLEDTSGKELVPAVYEELYPQGPNNWIASLNSHYGIINDRGEWTVKPEYQQLVQSVGDRFVAGKKVKPEKKKRTSYYRYNENDSVVRYGIVDRTSGKWIIDASYEYISLCDDGNIIYMDDYDNYGFLDKDGKELIKAQYDFVSYFSEDLAVVSDGGSEASKYNSGYFNRSFYISSSDVASYDSRNRYSGGKWKIINRKGETVTKQQYDYIRDYRGGRAAYNSGGLWKKKYSYGTPHLVSGLWGFLDKDGKEVIAAQYDYVYDFKNGVAKVRQGDRTFYIDLNGKEVAQPPKQDSLLSNEPQIFCQPGHYGYIDAKGDWVIEPQFVEAYSFSEGLAGAKVAKGDDLECSESTDYSDYYDDYNEPPLFRLRNRRRTVTYDAIMQARENIAYRSSYGYVDKTGKMVIEGKYEDVMPFSEGLAYVRMHGQYGIIDKTGKWIMQPILEAPFGGGYDYVDYYEGEGDKTYQPSYNRENHESWQTNYNYYYHFSEGMGVIRKYEKYGFVDKTGKIVIAPIFDDVRPFAGGLAAVEKNERWGYIDKTGRIVIPIKYTNAYDFSDGMALISEPLKHSADDTLFVEDDDKRWGYIDPKGKFVIESQFTDANPFHDGLAVAQMNFGKAGYIDKTGKFIIAPRYTSANNFMNGFAQVEVPGAQVVFIDKTGKVSKVYNDKNPPPLGPEPLKMVQDEDKKFGYKNDKGEWIIKPMYVDAGEFSTTK